MTTPRKYPVDPYFQELWERRERAVQLIHDTLKIGAEYSNSNGTTFGVFLEEMSTTKYPYRISWYDKDGFFSHQGLTTQEAAVDELIDMLGYDLKTAPGSLESLFQHWEPIEKREAMQILAQKQDGGWIADRLGKDLGSRDIKDLLRHLSIQASHLKKALILLKAGTSGHALWSKYGDGVFYRYEQLPSKYKKAFDMWTLEWQPREKAQSKARFGLAQIPVEELKTLYMNMPDIASHFTSFDDYHAWYIAGEEEELMNKYTELWPVLLSSDWEDEALDDGNHRFHVYIERGIDPIPAMYIEWDS